MLHRSLRGKNWIASERLADLPTSCMPPEDRAPAPRAARTTGQDTRDYALDLQDAAVQQCLWQLSICNKTSIPSCIHRATKEISASET